MAAWDCLPLHRDQSRGRVHVIARHQRISSAAARGFSGAKSLDEQKVDDKRLIANYSVVPWPRELLEAAQETTRMLAKSWLLFRWGPQGGSED